MKDIKKKTTILHLSGWAFAYLFFFLVFWGERPANPLLLATASLLVSAFVFYSHYLLLSRYWGKRRYGAYLPGLLLLLLISPVLFMLAFGVATEEWYDFPVPYLAFFTLSLIFVLLSWIVRVTENWFLNALKRERLEKQAVQAELSYLKSQINPHFLFNTLNNIHTLVYKQSAAAPDAVRCLSSLMRYMIYESNVNTVPLDREFAYLQDFMSLQQLRYKNAPVADVELTGDISSCEIAPLLLIHLLENAYKHSPARLSVGDIKVRIEVNENTLTFSTRNPIRSKSSKTMEKPGGIGLDNVRKRLQLLYPGQHSLAINSTEELFNADLQIPCHYV